LKAATLVSQGKGRGFRVRVGEVPVPEPREGDIIVKMEACGLCGTDLEKIRGGYTASMPVIGHEAVGRVVALGEGVSQFKVGDSVFPHHHVPCHECYLCNSGSETMCDRYRTSNIDPGGFAERFKVPKWNVGKGGVLPLPDGLDFAVASLIEPVACCIRALAKLRVMQDETVLVAGAGPVGMMHALLLQEVGARVLMSDVSKERLRFAEKEGVAAVFDARKDVPAQVAKETDGRGADAAVVATGSKDAIVQSLRSIRKGGQVCLFGVPPKGTVLDYDISELYNKEQRILTSYAATEVDTKSALRIISANPEGFGRLISHKIRLADFANAVEVATKGEGMKLVVVP
jgi:L-iditol 2-dehydrogenase